VAVAQVEFGRGRQGGGCQPSGSGLATSGQEVGKAAGGEGSDALEDVAEILEGVDAVALARGDGAAHDRSDGPAVDGADRLGVIAVQGDLPQGSPANVHPVDGARAVG